MHRKIFMTLLMVVGLIILAPIAGQAVETLYQFEDRYLFPHADDDNYVIVEYGSDQDTVYTRGSYWLNSGHSLIFNNVFISGWDFN
jgi:hypothetical protein